MYILDFFMLFFILLITILIILFIFTYYKKKKTIFINSRTLTNSSTPTKNTQNQLSINVEIVDNFVTRAFGLMFRKKLGEQDGMLFIFDKEDFYPFWMFCTFIPLDGIFIDTNGIIVDIIEMESSFSFNSKKYIPKKKAKYVVEVNIGFCNKNDIKIGDSFLMIWPAAGLPSLI